jgi:hypothetical protein
MGWGCLQPRTRRKHVSDTGFADRQVGQPGDGILDGVVAVENLESDPVDQRGALAVVQGNTGDPPVTEDEIIAGVRQQADDG